MTYANHIDEETMGYRELGPDQVLDAVESLGYVCDGRLLALNSYENRVYQIGIEERAPVIGKFYRPHRWSDDAIQEEHDFARELSNAELQVIAPLHDKTGRSLHKHGPFRFALFERCGGRAPDLDNFDNLERLGRLFGRIHAVGRIRPFNHRPTLSIESYGEASSQFLLENNFIPNDLIPAYQSLAEDLLKRIRWCFERAGEFNPIRMHGDSHIGNILWTDDGPHIVDLDDARMGPAIQDLWMFLSGERAEQTTMMDALLEGYTQFFEFNPRELHLIEALRTLRLMHYYAWIARRWEDPAFPRVFPWFDTQKCWEQHILDLREQAALMDEPPLQLPQFTV